MEWVSGVRKGTGGVTDHVLRGPIGVGGEVFEADVRAMAEGGGEGAEDEEESEKGVAHGGI